MAVFKFEQIAKNITEKRMPTPEDKYTYIGLEHLDSGKLNVTRWGSEVDLIGQKLVMHKGDVLFGRRNTYLKRVAIAPHDGIFSAHGMIMRPNEEVVDKNFFPFFIQSDYFMDAAIRISVGSLSPTLNWKDLKELKFNLPSLDRQKEMAKVMMAFTESKESYENLLFQLDELVKARFVEMFGSINDNKFGYDVMTLQYVCELIKDGTHQTPTYTEDTINGYKFLSSKDVTSGKVDWEHLKYIPEELHNELYKRISPRKGDILLAKNGTTGVAAIVDRDEVFDIYVSLALLRPSKMVTSEYLCSAVNSAETKYQFDGSLKGIGVPNLHLGEIKKTMIIVPPMELQEQFADFVHQVDKSKFAVQSSLDSLNIAKKSFMDQELIND